MGARKIIRFQPNGPGNKGLQEWDPIDPAGLEAGTPIQRGHIYHEDSASGYMAGVWDCTPMTERFGPYAVNEFMLLLEGSVTMIRADGGEAIINAGESFIVPKGLPCQWKQDGYVRKYFVIFENPGTPAADNVSAQGVILPKLTDPGEETPWQSADGAGEFAGDTPTARNHTCFTDPSHQFSCGLWDSSAFETPAVPCPRNELVILVQGSMTLTDENGHEHLFEAGETAYVPKGVSCGRRSTGDVRTLYCRFDPS